MRSYTLRQAQGNPLMRKGFTLIELLVVIAIIAILAIVVILTLNPGQLLAQARDSTRLSDLASLQSALGYYQTDAAINGRASLGTPSTVYASLPDPTATSTQGNQCQGLGLPSLPPPYAYHCAASSTARFVDGSGWLPVAFTSISHGSSLGQLPIDPTNTSSSRSYYTYTTDGQKFELTASLESSKYKLGGSNDAIANDGGTLATLYEKGTKLGLMPLDYGDPSLVGYWPFDEGSGSTAYDWSGNNASGSWSGTQAGTSGYYSPGRIGGWGGYFNGSNDYVNNINIAIPSSNFSFSLWFYLNQTAITLGHGVTFLALNGTILYQHAANNYLYYGYGARYIDWTPTAGSWHYLACSITFGGSSGGPDWQGSCYGDGISQFINQSGYLFSSSNLQIGDPSFPGLIDDVRIYNRALSASEIAALYAGGK